MKAGRELKRTAPEIRFWKFINKTENCWEWTGCTVKGYGSFNLGGRYGTRILAHRFSLKLVGRIIPDGYEVCHKCDNRKCVNPDHLFVGTRSDNMKDCSGKNRLKLPMHNKKKTHCPLGHEYSGTNLIVTKSNWRKCKICSYAKQNLRRRKLS